MWHNQTVRWEGDQIRSFIEKVCMFCVFFPDSGKPTFYQRQANSPEAANDITDTDIGAINNYGARSPSRVWKRLRTSGLLSSALASVSLEWSLFEIAPAAWSDVRQHLLDVLSLCLEERGVALSTATKVLHLKRPKLIPICDSVVLGRLLGLKDSSSSVERGIQCIEKMRSIGQVEENRRIILIAQKHLSSALPADNPYASMTPLRVLEAVLWLETRQRKPCWPLLGWQ